jgi:hypothetical protein
MVDFPEGYGFKRGHKAKIVQEVFTVEVGVFSRRDWAHGRSPYAFECIAIIRKEKDEEQPRGILFNAPGMGPIRGTLQQVVTALCTLHRMKGHMK